MAISVFVICIAGLLGVFVGRIMWDARQRGIMAMKMKECTDVLQDPSFRFRSEKEAEFFLAALERENYDVAYRILEINREAIDADMA